jgi:hypothetical protein
MLQGTSPDLRTAFTAALLLASRTWPLSSMCFIVVKELKCVTQFPSERKPHCTKKRQRFLWGCKDRQII